jgi:lipopolysaccharide assembly outer membrane protein LptD (OstA)
LRRHGRIAAAWLACAAPAAAAPAAEPQPPVHVQADEVEYDRGLDVYEARGHVVIEREGRRLTADWVSFHPVTRKGVAAGNVVLTEAQDRLTADFVHFDVDTLEGIVFDGELDSASSRFRLAGGEIRKTGEQTYEFEAGRFTTCRCPDPGRDPWSLSAERADLEIEGYGTARNTTFEILDVPVLWLPWMIYPLKTERQSGLLFPELSSSSRSGFEVGLPVFWAARHNINVLATPRYLAKRGYKQDLEVDYVFGERSEGSLFGAILPHDDDIHPRDPSTPFSPTRWGAEWLHDQELPHDWRFMAEVREFSDNLYTFQFRDLGAHRSDRFVQSRTFVTGEAPGLGPLGAPALFAGVGFANDQQNPDDEDRDRFILQRLPALAGALPAATGLEVFGRPLAPSFDVAFTSFEALREVDEVYPGSLLRVVGDDLFADTGIDAIPDGEERDPSGVKVAGDANRDDFPSFPNGTEGNGVFDEGEPLLDRGQRLTLNPRLALPLRVLDFLELYPEVGYLGTLYATQAQGYADRHLFTAQLDARTRIDGSFALPFGGGTVQHLLEPRLGYTVLSSTTQRDNPLFVPEARVAQERIRQLELLNVTRDPGDRLDSVHALTLALGNRLYRRAADGPSRLFADLTLSGQYALDDDELDSVFVDGIVYPHPEWRGRIGFGYDLDDSHVREGLAQIGWRADAGHDLVLRYRYLGDVPRVFEDFQFDHERFDSFIAELDRVHQVSVLTRWAVTPNWALTYEGSYSFEDSFSISHSGGVEYASRCRCWALRLEVADDRASGVEVNLDYRIYGLGRDVDPARPFERRGGWRGALDAPGPL